MLPVLMRSREQGLVGDKSSLHAAAVQLNLCVHVAVRLPMPPHRSPRRVALRDALSQDLLEAASANKRAGRDALPTSEADEVQATVVAVVRYLVHVRVIRNAEA